ncbi:MAG: response regulator [Rhodospirillales bacterium]|nr:response regulator [Rhodospirillales bacterium]MDP6773251.1 response regulator [Rhodospirillales bacterium]
MAETTTDQLNASEINLEEIKILVVDDNAFMRSLVRQLLKALGAREIFEASDGQEGYEVARQVKPDIALVDWVMEPEDGIQFVKNVRSAEDSPNRLMPIIMVSGYSEESRVLAARDAGANEFVVKPLSATSLFTRIQWVVENPRRFVTTDTYFGPDRRRKDVPFKGEDRRVSDQEEKAPADEGDEVFLDVEAAPAGDEADAEAGDGDGDDEAPP